MLNTQFHPRPIEVGGSLRILMNESSYFADFTEKDREIIKKIIRRLLAETNIVRDRDEISRDFFFFARRPLNLQAINNYLAEIGLMAVPDDSGYIRIAESETNASRIRTGHARLEKNVSQILLALAWIYFEKERLYTKSDIIISIGELIVTLEKFHFEKIIDSIKRADYIFNRLSDFNLIKVVGKLGDSDCKLCIYPSIKMSLSQTNIASYVAKFNSEKNKAKSPMSDENETDSETPIINLSSDDVINEITHDIMHESEDPEIDLNDDEYLEEEERV